MHKPYCNTHGAQRTTHMKIKSRKSYTQKTRVNVCSLLLYLDTGYRFEINIIFHLKCVFFGIQTFFLYHFFHTYFSFIIFRFCAPQIKCSHLSFCSITRCAVNKLMLFVCLSSIVVFHCNLEFQVPSADMKNAQHRWKMM